MRNAGIDRPSSKPLRIVFLGQREGVGGAVPRIVSELSSGLAERGWHVSHKLWGARSSSEGLAVKAVSRARDAIVLANAINAEGPDVVIVHSGMEWRTLLRDLLLCARLRRHVRTIVLQPHGGHAEWVGDDRPTVFRLLARDLLKLVDGVFVLSWEEAVFYARGGPTVAVERVANPFAAVDYPDAEDLGTSHGIRLLFVGRVVEDKGILETIEAMRLLSCGATLTIAGDGPLLPGARGLSRALGVQDRVRFVGRVEGQNLHDLYVASDVLVLPTYWVEGFPTVLAEAMAAGLGIVTTPTRGARDYLVDGVNCVFVLPRRPADVAAAIDRLHSQRQLLRDMGETNRRDVRRFSSSLAVDQYEKSLRRVIARVTGGVC